jgi:hypothetical protein
VLGICVMVRLLDSTAEQYEATESYLTHLSMVFARAGSFEPGVVSRIHTQPDVARTIPARSLWVTVPMFGPLPSDFPLFGVSGADLPALMEVCDLRLEEGRLPQARSNEVALAEALGLQVGAAMDRSVDATATVAELAGRLEAAGLLDSGRLLAEELYEGWYWLPPRQI